MRKVQRGEIVDYQTYEEIRDSFREQVFAAKARRRIHVGDCFTFLFENPLTIRYQVQEMMRAEKTVREKEIQHEIETYNGLLGDEGQLGSTLLIEIDDPVERAAKLREWLVLPMHVYARMEDGRTIRAQFDKTQLGSDRISSVQYIKFSVGGEVPVALGIDLPSLDCEVRLTDDQKSALAEDLAS